MLVGGGLNPKQASTTRYKNKTYSFSCVCFEKLVFSHRNHDISFPGTNIYFPLLFHTWKSRVILLQVVFSTFKYYHACTKCSLVMSFIKCNYSIIADIHTEKKELWSHSKKAYI